eukprot:scaffold1616_cov100-Skeletonema_dohrnii-CCMP3373.AAC.11
MRRQSDDVTILREAAQKLQESQAQAATTEPYPHPNVTPMKRDCAYGRIGYDYACSRIERPSFRHRCRKEGTMNATKEASKSLKRRRIDLFRGQSQSYPEPESSIQHCIGREAGVGSDDNK